MMEAHGDFIGRIGLVLNPVADVIKQLPDIRLDAEGRNAEITIGGAISAGPSPDFMEHAAMQPAQERLSEHIASPLECPLVGSENV